MKVKEHRCPWCGEQIKAMSAHNNLDPRPDLNARSASRRGGK